MSDKRSSENLHQASLPPLNASGEFNRQSPLRKSFNSSQKNEPSPEKLPKANENKNYTTDKFVPLNIVRAATPSDLSVNTTDQNLLRPT